MTMTTPASDPPLQPKILKFLEGLRRKGKLTTNIQLVELLAGRPSETILDIDPIALRGDLRAIADDITALLQQRADERRASVRSNLVTTDEELFLPCRPSASESPIVRRRHVDEEGLSELVDNAAGFPEEDPASVSSFVRGGLRHQGAVFSLELFKQVQAQFRLTLAAALRREERDTRRIDQLERQVVRYQNAFDQVMLTKEQLLDRQAERQLEVDRVKQKDKWMQDGFAKIISLVALHAPAILPKFGIALDPRAREILYDVVGSVPAAKPYVNAMRLASSMTEQGGTEEKKLTNGSNGAGSNNATHTNGAATNGSTQTTAGAIAQSTISGGGESVGAGALAIFSALTTQFLTGVKDKMVMVRPMLAEEHATLLDKILELSEAHGSVFQAVGNAAIQGHVQVTADGGGPPPSGEEDKKLMRFVDLCGVFFAAVRPADAEKMHKFLAPAARGALDELRRDFDLSKLAQPTAN
jgi:hypothetical protein